MFTNQIAVGLGIWGRGGMVDAAKRGLQTDAPGDNRSKERALSRESSNLSAPTKQVCIARWYGVGMVTRTAKAAPKPSCVRGRYVTGNNRASASDNEGSNPSVSTTKQNTEVKDD